LCGARKIPFAVEVIPKQVVDFGDMLALRIRGQICLELIASEVQQAILIGLDGN
jgi:hypothetical protein